MKKIVSATINPQLRIVVKRTKFCTECYYNTGNSKPYILYHFSYIREIKVRLTI